MKGSDTESKLLLLQEYSRIISLIYESSAKPELMAEIMEQVSQLTKDFPTLEHQAQPAIDDLSAANNQAALPTQQGMQTLQDLLSPHLTQSIQLGQEIKQREHVNEQLTQLLDQLPVAVAIINHKFEILDQNLLAGRLLENEQYFNIKRGVLHFNDSDDDRQFRTVLRPFIRLTIDTEHSTLTLNGSELFNHTPFTIYAININPTYDKESIPQPTCALIFSDVNSALAANLRSLQHQYHLTDKESKILAQLVQGESIKQIAETQSNSVHTIRTHVKTMLSKTNVRRQVELIQLASATINAAAIPAISTIDKQLTSTPDTTTSDAAFLTLADNRRLAYKEYGPVTGTPVIFCHSIIGSRQERPLNLDSLASNHIRLIVPDRPGIGLSDFLPEQSLLGWAEDIQQLTAQLNLDDFHVLGLGLGGPFAMAVCHHLSDHVKSLVLIDSTAPLFRDKEINANSSLFSYFMPKIGQLSKPLHRQLTAFIVSNLKRNPDRVLHQLNKGLNPCDREMFARDDVQALVKTTLAEIGPLTGDAVSLHQLLNEEDWGFDIGDIKVPIYLFYGNADPVTTSWSTYLRKHLPDHHAFKVADSSFLQLLHVHWDYIITEWLNDDDRKID